MKTFATTPGAQRLFVLSLVARLPLVMFGIALLVHAEHLTDSFAAAGIVTGAYAVALGVGGPLLARLVDRRGQTLVLVASAAVSAGLLGGAAMLPEGTATATIALLAAAIGLASPPIGACLRALLPGLLRDPAALRAAYAFDASASELTWIAGPPLALGVGALWSTGAALAAGGAALLVATVAFAAQPASRRWRPEPPSHDRSRAPLAAPVRRSRGGALRSPAMRTLVVVLIAVGVLFGGVEVAVTVASEELGGTATAGPLLGIWGVGSLIGGMLAVRFGGHGAAGLTLLLGALTVGHMGLVAAAGSVLALAAVLLVAGAAIAPTYATVFGMVERAAPAGTVTEAFAWLNTAVAIGAAAGSAGAGAIADSAGPAAAFALAACAGAVALLAATLRSATVAQPAPA